MFDSLTERLGSVFDRLSGRGVLGEKDIDEALREVRVALIEADVALPVVKDFISKARFRKLMADRGFPLEADQHVCHIIAESNGGANHIDNFFVAAGSLNQSLGNKNDAYLAEVAGREQVRKAVAVSRTTGYTGPGADELIAMAKAARA